MSKVYAISNQKGGVAKSTTAVNMAACLSGRGKRVLLIDIDPQCNLSTIADAINDGMDRKAIGTIKNIEMVMKDSCTIGEAVQHKEKYDIVPSSMLLATIDSALNPFDKLHKVKKAVDSIKDNYDYIFIDCPPSLGTLTANALVAADEVIIPACADILSYQGVTQLVDTIQAARNLNGDLKISGILITRYHTRKRLNRDLLALFIELANSIGTRLLDSRIRECSAVAEAQAQAEDIYTYDKKCNAAEDYTAAVNEIFGKGDAE